jgi:riboflavin kinase/FMN adenylyltransferase
MRILNSLDGGTGGDRPAVIAAGSFDGVHLGHQHIIRTAVERARAAGGEAWVLTFDPHPLKLLDPGRAPPILTAMPERLRLMGALGPDGCFVLPFTLAFARQAPEDFVEALRAKLPGLAAIVVGTNWRFGRDALGDADLLRTLERRHGFRAHLVDPVCWAGEPVSSTRIRRAIAEAHFDQVQAMLQRAYTVSGRVVHGRKVGRRLGFPTANIVPSTEVLPPHGIFAVWARLADGVLPAAAYYGHRPTFPDAAESFSLEVYLLDFEADLYGQQVDVVFEEMIRPDCDFPSEEELKAQIERDLAAVRGVLAGRKRPPARA